MDIFADDGGSDDMFGDESDEEPTYEDPPDYIKTEEFIEWAEAHNVHVDEKFGFLQLRTFKPFYYPG